MEMRKIGNTDIAIAPLVLGGNVFGWSADEATSFAVLDAFAAEGLQCIDTADTYSGWVPGNSGGESETIIGRWLKKSGKRDQVVKREKLGVVCYYALASGFLTGKYRSQADLGKSAARGGAVEKYLNARG